MLRVIRRRRRRRRGRASQTGSLFVEELSRLPFPVSATERGQRAHLLLRDDAGLRKFTIKGFTEKKTDRLSTNYTLYFYRNSAYLRLILPQVAFLGLILNLVQCAGTEQL